MIRTGRARDRTLSRVGSWAILLAGIVAALWLARPEASWQPPRIEQHPGDNTSEHSTPDLPTLDELAVIWKRDLRQRLFDPPPAPKVAKPPPKLNLQLVGTAVEPDRCYAILRRSNNATLIRSVGQHVDEFELTEIDRGRVRLRRGDQEYELRVPWYNRIAAGGNGGEDG